MSGAKTPGPPALQIGCQTYTWEMLGDDWAGSTDDLLDAIAGAGYAGIEITDTMIGAYADRPAAFAAALHQRHLTLVAFACGSASGFTEPGAMDEDLAMVEQALRFAAAFPGALLSLGSATAVSPGPLDAKFNAAATFYNRAGALGQRVGVPVAIHASSHHNTILATRAEYDRILGMTEPALVGWVPDTGHILRGGQDLAETLTAHRDRIRYVHLKDVDAVGQWQMLGQGVCDIRAVIAIARTAPHFTGWLVLEEESDLAARDPAAAVRLNREYLTGLIAARGC